MRNQNKNVSLSLVPSDSVERVISAATSELALALGLVRILTLLPLYDGTLDEVESHLAAGWEAVRELRRLIDDATASGGSS
jgi:hypothetical protein